MKERVVNKQFASVKVVENYLKKYNNIVIVTSRENEMLNEQFKSAKTLEEAEERYKKLGIVVEEFDATMTGSSLQEFFI